MAFDDYPLLPCLQAFVGLSQRVPWEGKGSFVPGTRCNWSNDGNLSNGGKVPQDNRELRTKLIL